MYKSTVFELPNFCGAKQMMEEKFAALNDHHIFVSYDVEETEAQISTIIQPHRLRPIARVSAYQAEMSFLRFADIGIGRIRYSAPMSLNLDCLGNYYLIMFCRKGSARLKNAGGERIAGNQYGACMAPGEPIVAEFSENCEQIIFTINKDIIQRRTHSRNPHLIGQIDLSKDAFSPWIGFIRSFLENRHTINLVKNNHKIASEYQAVFLSTFLNGSLNADKDKIAGIVPVAVKRAEHFINRNYNQPISLADISAAAGVSDRTLLNTFQRFRQKSPMRALRDRRLDAAREKLLNAKDRNTVLDIALDVGFGHPGRFALAYAERFGEKPSETYILARRAVQ